MAGRAGRPRGELIPQRARPATGAAVLALVAVVLLAGTVSAAADRRAGARLVRDAAGRPGVQLLADVGDAGWIVAASALLVGGLLWAGQLRGAALAAVSPAVSAVLVELVGKPLSGRRFHGALSFPSGHQAAVVTVCAAAVVALRAVAPRHLLRAVTIVLAVLCVLVGAALVAAGYHRVSDVVAGSAVGVATVLASSLAIDAVAQRRR